MSARYPRRVAVVLTLMLMAAAIPPRLGARAAQQSAAAIESAADISPEALAQIEALLAEKAARSTSQQKLDSQLIYELRMLSGAPVARGLDMVQTDVPYANDGHAVLDVQARVTPALTGALAALDAEVLSTSDDGSSLRIHIAIDRVQALATLPDVIFIQPHQAPTTSRQAASVPFAPTGKGTTSTEGDLTHRAFVARGYGGTGAGVKIGVLSDGVRNLASSQAAGDLGPVTVIGPATGCAPTVTCDEGTAMLEIIHDIAPDAQLYFATAFISISSFADNIRKLREAGCDIIVDDVFYPSEAPFQDGQAPGIVSTTNGGAIAQAVNDVVADGALYFSSAGNGGNKNDGTSGVWEGDFADAGAAGGVLRGAGVLHRFPNGQTFDVITAIGTGQYNLYWANPLGAATDDYDLFALNATGTAVISASTNSQNGTQDPFEAIAPTGVNTRIVIVKFAGAGRFLRLGTNRGRLSVNTAGAIWGHSAGEGAYSVAATPASNFGPAPNPAGPFPNPFTSQNVVELFSSDGPRRLFFDANGAPIGAPGDLSATGGIDRPKPDITAADGVSVTGVGNFTTPFFGSSAAAPHAAAIAALIKSTLPGITPAEMRKALTSSALDIEAPGVDRDSGAGIIMADAALESVGVADVAALLIDGLQASDNPGNGNGLPEAGEGVRLTIPIANVGDLAATHISARLTSDTPGITITEPSTTAYADIPVSGTSSNRAPFLFTVASDFPCPRAATFTLTLQYEGGPSPRVLTFEVPIGQSSYQITTTLDTVAPPPSPGVSTTTGIQTVRLNREGVPSVCGTEKPLPPLASNAAGARQFDAYSFDACSTEPTCVSVTLSAANGLNLFTAAYSPAFNPANIQQDYKADPAASAAPSRHFSFDLPAGPQKFAIDVHDVPPGLAIPSGSVYTLNVAGACMGACNPPNLVPIARAKDVTAIADNTCGAAASIDGGSIDPDGDTLAITQSPAGPYPVGTTPVLLTVVDPKGATSQAMARVTVLDNIPPVISCPAPVVVSTSRGVCTAPVSFAVTASDRCSSPAAIVSEPASGSLFGLGTTTVTSTATDTSGNPASCDSVVTVEDHEAPVVSDLLVSIGSPVRLANGVKADTRAADPDSSGDAKIDFDKMVDVTVGYLFTDNCSGSCVLDVKSNEATSRPPSWTVLDANHVRFDLDNSGKGKAPRDFTLTLTCTDGSGNATIKTARVVLKD